MLVPEDLPTPLVDAGDRPAIRLVPPDLRTFRTARITFRFAVLAVRLAARKLRGRLTAAGAGALVREVVEGLGGFWVKWAQVVSLRLDVLPVPFCLELMKCQDRMAGFPGEVARAILQAELRRPIDELFADFEDRPVAAASIGQVHRATLRAKGVRVAIKVQRPAAPEQFDGDLRFLERVVRFAGRFRALAHFQLEEGVRELRIVLEEELDYRWEAAALERMRRQLGDHGIYVPRTWKRYHTPRVLVMEYVDGVLMSDYLAELHRDPDRVRRWLDENGIDPKRVASRLYQSFLRQLFEEEYFHGDLHPGNIVLLRDGKIALLDFGGVGNLEKHFLGLLARNMLALVERRFKQAAEYMIRINEPVPAVNLDAFAADMTRTYAAWAAKAGIPSLPFIDRSSGTLVQLSAQVASRHGFPFHWDLLRMSRANLTLEVSLMHLDPEMNLLGEMGRYFRAAAARQQDLARAGGRVRALALQGAVASRDLPRRIAELGDDLVSILNRNALRIQSTASKVSTVMSSLLRGLQVGVRLAGVVLVAVFLEQCFGPLALESESISLDDALRRFPALGFLDWLGAFSLFLLVDRTMAEVVRKLGEEDSGH